jgi:single-strand DNA-binding protein
MARTLNRVTLIGVLGFNPEVRNTPQGMSVCTIKIATTENYKDKNGEWQEITDWHNIVLWNRLADIAKEYLKKGSKVYVEGKLRTRSYEDKDGVTKYVTEIIASNMILLTPKESQPSGTSNTHYNAPAVSDSVVKDNDYVDDVPF